MTYETMIINSGGIGLSHCKNDGTPYEGKLSRTVWSGGKFGSMKKKY